MPHSEDSEASIRSRIIAALKNPARVLGMTIIVLALFLFDAALIEPRWIKINYLKLANRPTHTLVHISDIHYKGNSSYLWRAVRRINKINPDFVCLTGDIIETEDMLTEAMNILCEIHAPLYVVPGNHEYWARADLSPARKLLSEQGGALLESEAVMHFDNNVQILGDSIIQWDYAQAIAPGRKHVFLTHYPDKAARLSGATFDIILAGHSHGGQARIPFYGALLRMAGAYDFQRGLYDTSSGPLYVSAGLGTYFLDLRFLCRPEITVISI